MSGKNPESLKQVGSNLKRPRKKSLMLKTVRKKFKRQKKIPGI